jgi:hypothetical protein
MYDKINLIQKNNPFFLLPGGNIFKNISDKK